jgi:hypothetical protein
MPLVWSVRGGRDGDMKYLQLFKGGVLYPIREELATEILARAPHNVINLPEVLSEFTSAKDVKVHEISGDGPELITHPSRVGEGISYAIRLYAGGDSFIISPGLAYDLKHTNKLALVEVGRRATKRESGKAMIYRLSPMELSSIDGSEGRIYSHRM